MTTELDKARAALAEADSFAASVASDADPDGTVFPREDLARAVGVGRDHLRVVLTEVDRLTAALAEAEATIANERGEGGCQVKPITHSLAIAYVEAFKYGTFGGLDRAMARFKEADCPLYADPTPMPAPALGMRAYGTYPPEPDGTVSLTESDDIYHLKPGAEWCDYLDPAARIDLIVDFRTREVLWRRS